MPAKKKAGSVNVECAMSSKPLKDRCAQIGVVCIHVLYASGGGISTVPRGSHIPCAPCDLGQIRVELRARYIMIMREIGIDAFTFDIHIESFQFLIIQIHASSIMIIMAQGWIHL